MVWMQKYSGRTGQLSPNAAKVQQAWFTTWRLQ